MIMVSRFSGQYRKALLTGIMVILVLKKLTRQL
jgi:hypothetical protein